MNPRNLKIFLDKKVSFIYNNKIENMKKIDIPTNCPSCDSVLELVNEQLFCRNDYCEAKNDKKLENFVSKLKIKGLGPATLKKLKVEDIVQLYQLERHEIIMRLDSEKIGSKVYEELEKSKSVDLQTLLPAFSIPLIGRSVSEKLCETVSNIRDINELTCSESGIGPKATENLLLWLGETFYPNHYLDLLPFDFTSSYKAVEVKEVKGTVCITGKLKSYPTKAHAQKVLENYGFIVKSSLTKDCTHLINEGGVESSKTQTARDRGVEIINNIKSLIGEI
jgi:DNA ligase (NAD+)